MADQIPAAHRRDHTPGFDGAIGIGLDRGWPVLELNRLPGIDGGQQDSQGVFRPAKAHGAQTGGDRNTGRGIHVDPGRSQLQQRTLCGGNPLGGLP